MADYFCDHGAYASALGTTPTWGAPQEGDGSSKDPATASATVEIVFTANAAAGNTVSVCGVTFTAVASGATGNQFNVGADLNASLNNLCTAINASTTAVGSGVAVGTPQLRNLVFARNGGGTALQVMMRVGSATLNGATNTNCRATVSGWASSTTLPADFAGGSGGCWGWLMNTAAIGVSSSYAALAYGVAVAALPMVSASAAAPAVSATPTIADPIYVRTGAGYTLTCAVNTAPNFGGPSYNQQLVFDSNTIWTSDSGTGQITVSVSQVSSDLGVRMVPNTSSVSKILRCLRRDALRIFFASSSGGGFSYVVAGSGGRSAALIEGVAFETPTTYSTGSPSLRVQLNNYAGVRFRRCNFYLREARTTFAGAVTSGTLDGSAHFEGCSWLFNHTGGAEPGTIVGNFPLFGASSMRFVGCKFSGWPFGRYRVFPAGMSLGSGAEAIAEGCTGIALGTAYIGVSANRFDNPNLHTVVTHSYDAGQGYRYEYGAGVVDWNPDASPAYPTRSALLGDNTTPWSVKLDWFANVVNPLNVLSTPRMSSINRLGDGVRTVALDFLTPIALTAMEVSMRVHYVGTDGAAYCDSTVGNSAALTAPGATWTGISNYPAHMSRRLTLTTSQPVKQGSEIAIYFEVTGAPPGGSGVQLYVDPEAAVS